MNGEIRCPKCKGDKFSYAGENTFKCAYCGTVFQLPKPEPTPQPQPAPVQASTSQPIVVNVQVPQQPTTDEQPPKKKSKAKSCLQAIAVFYLVMIILYWLFH